MLHIVEQKIKMVFFVSDKVKKLKIKADQDALMSIKVNKKN